MDALEFLKEERRMCKSFDIGCVKCPLGDIGCCVSPEETDEEFEKEIAIVEQWSKEHSRKTRQSVFLEQYPDTIIDMFGVIQLCPMYVSTAYRTSDGECKYPENLCIDCRHKFWMQEVE